MGSVGLLLEPWLSVVHWYKIFGQDLNYTVKSGGGGGIPLTLPPPDRNRVYSDPDRNRVKLE